MQVGKTNLKIAGTSTAAECAAFLAKQKKLGVKTFNGAEVVLTDENGNVFEGEIKNLRKVNNGRLIHNCAFFIQKYVQDFSGKDFTGQKFIDLIPYVEEILTAADEAADIEHKHLKIVKP